MNGDWQGVSGHFSIPRNECDISYDISVEAINSCGTSAKSHANAYIPCNNYFALSPNPATTMVTVFIDQNQMLKASIGKTIDEIKIYDNLGNLKK